MIRFHKSLLKNVEFVLQYSLLEQVRNDRENCLQPTVTQCGSYVKVPYKSSATKGKKIGARRKSYKALIVDCS